MPRPRSEKVAIGFMAAWLVFWAAGMLIVLYGLGGAVPRGELGHFQRKWVRFRGSKMP